MDAPPTLPAPVLLTAEACSAGIALESLCSELSKLKDTGLRIAAPTVASKQGTVRSKRLKPTSIAPSSGDSFAQSLIQATKRNNDGGRCPKRTKSARRLEKDARWKAR